jgi:hypothetical protein
MIVDVAYIKERLGIDDVHIEMAIFSGRLPNRAEWELDDIEVYLKPWERALNAKRKNTDRDRAYSCVKRTIEGV